MHLYNTHTHTLSHKTQTCASVLNRIIVVRPSRVLMRRWRMLGHTRTIPFGVCSCASVCASERIERGPLIFQIASYQPLSTAASLPHSLLLFSLVFISVERAAHTRSTYSVWLSIWPFLLRPLQPSRRIYFIVSVLFLI